MWGSSLSCLFEDDWYFHEYSCGSYIWIWQSTRHQAFISLIIYYYPDLDSLWNACSRTLPPFYILFSRYMILCVETRRIFKPLCHGRIEQRTLWFPWNLTFLTLLRCRTKAWLITHLYYHEGMQWETEMYISDSSSSQHIEVNSFLKLPVITHVLSKNWRCVSGPKNFKILANPNM